MNTLNLIKSYNIKFYLLMLSIFFVFQSCSLRVKVIRAYEDEYQDDNYEDDSYEEDNY